LPSIEHAYGAEILQIGNGLRLAADGNDTVAATREHIDRETPHAAACTRHENFARGRILAVLFHAMDRERGRESRPADRHALEFVEGRWDGDDPLRGHARVLG